MSDTIITYPYPPMVQMDDGTWCETLDYTSLVKLVYSLRDRIIELEAERAEMTTFANDIHMFEGAKEVNLQNCISGILDRLTALEDKTTGLATNLIGKSEQEKIYQAGYREGRRSAALEQGKPAEDEPKQEWKVYGFDELVWWWDDDEKMSKKLPRVMLDKGDLWMPYYDGDEPPAPPKEVE